jgi:hypothetical protein
MSQAEAGKGSRPRPYSVSQQEYDQRWDAIFGRDLKEEQSKKGTCGCGRSPTGNCIGWHSLSEDAYQQKLKEYREK